MSPPKPATAPNRVVLEGRYVHLEPLAPGHTAALYRASTPPDAAERFAYLFETPPASEADMQA